MKQLLFCLALTTTLCAQVSIPAVVVDSSGQAVHSLQKSDFSVHCGKIATFDSLEEVPLVGLTGFSDSTPVFILYDVISVPPSSQGLVANVLLDYLRRAAAERLPVTVLEDDGEEVRVIHDLSTDSSVLAAALQKIASTKSPPHVNSADPNFERSVEQEEVRLRFMTQTNYAYNGYGGILEDQETHQLTALQAIGKMLQHSGKRKLLAWITASFPLSMGSDELAHRPDAWEGQYWDLAISRYETAMQTLNQSRISVYPMRVLFPPTPRREIDPRSNVDGMGGIARATGGEVLGVLQNTNDFASSMEALRKKTDSYYMLSFSIQPPQKKSWIETKIQVNRPGTKVAAPKGFVAGP